MESKDLKPIDSFRVIPSERIFKSTFPDKNILNVIHIWVDVTSSLIQTMIFK